MSVGGQSFSNDGLYYDDPLQLADALRVIDQPLTAFGTGSFGRFRPLRLLSLAALLRVYGPESPWPFHAFALVLHFVNVLFLHQLLRKAMRTPAIPLDASQKRICVRVATLVFGVHWAGSEAVTYLSAMGMLFVTMGMFIMCLAVIPPEAQETRPCKPYQAAHAAVTFGFGLGIAVLGGEYWMALIPMVMCFAVWPGQDGRLRSRSLLTVGAILLATFAAYAWFQYRVVELDAAAQMHGSASHVLSQHLRLVYRILFPGDLIESLHVGIIFAVPALALSVGGVSPIRPVQSGHATDAGELEHHGPFRLQWAG